MLLLTAITLAFIQNLFLNSIFLLHIQLHSSCIKQPFNYNYSSLSSIRLRIILTVIVMSKILLLLASFLPLVSCRDMKKINKMIVNIFFLQNLIRKMLLPTSHRSKNIALIYYSSLLKVLLSTMVNMFGAGLLLPRFSKM